jgi:hypothetical protein
MNPCQYFNFSSIVSMNIPGKIFKVGCIPANRGIKTDEIKVNEGVDPPSTRYPSNRGTLI